MNQTVANVKFVNLRIKVQIFFFNLNFFYREIGCGLSSWYRTLSQEKCNNFAHVNGVNKHQ